MLEFTVQYLSEEWEKDGSRGYVESAGGFFC